MDLYLLAELKTIALKITTVDMLKPPADFRRVFKSAIGRDVKKQLMETLKHEKLRMFVK